MGKCSRIYSIRTSLTAITRENDWKGYQALKKERDTIGQNILSEWKEHLSYARQAGLSKESIEIACGLKMRPVSRIEEQAKFNIQEYCKKAMEARLLWREIRKTHPGRHCYEHSKYEEFDKLRLERNTIANDIVNNRPLYKDFISKIHIELGIGWKTIHNQSRQAGISLKDIHQKLEWRHISETLNKYQLEKPAHLTEGAFSNNIHKLNERMQLWNNLLGNSMQKIKEKDLIEKAIIAEAIKNDAKKEYCFLSTPLEAAVRSEGIAVATASLILEMGCNKCLNKALERGAQIYDDRLNKKSGLSLDENNLMHSRTQLGKLNELIGQQQNKEISISTTPYKTKDMGLEL